MTSKKKKEDSNYQLNMEILSSLKSIPGKVVNLQSENFINDELNKKLQYPEGKKTTSSSISKVSKDFFYEQYGEKSEDKKLITNNSVFKPMMNIPQKKSTMNFNFNPFNTVMSFPDLYLQNPLGNIQPNNDLSFSRNSYYVMNPNMDQNLNLYNQLNLSGNQMNTLTQINQINQFNFITNPFNNSFNSLNAINIPQISLNDIFLNNNTQNKNIFLNQKRNIDEKTEIKEKEKVNNMKKGVLFLINQKKEKMNMNTDINNINNTNSQETINKKNLFTVIPKSSYNYKKRKPRKRKLLNGIKKKLICNHIGCEGTFRTKKQLIYHHYKMNPQCHNDTILILKMIYNIKILLKRNNLEKNKIKFDELYKETMKKISLDEHIETLVGYNFEDEINEKND